MGMPKTAGLGGAARRARSPRRRVLASGSFQTLTGSARVDVRNLSCTGALVESRSSLRLGAEGVLRASHLDCLCTVVRREGGVYGLAFDEPIPRELVIGMHGVTVEDWDRHEAGAIREWFHSQAR